MFRKKSSAPQGRRRPQGDSVGRNAAVFSYRSISRPSEPVPARGRNIRQVEGENVSGAAITRRKLQHGWLKRGPRLATITILAVLLVCNLFVGTTPRVVTVANAGSSQVYVRPQSVYVQAAQRALSSSVLNRSKPTINTAKIAAELRRQYPELAHVTVSAPAIGTQPVVRIVPSAPVILLASVGQVYALDAAGKALIATNEAPDLTRLRLPLVDDQSGISITAGKIALPGSTVNFIAEVVGQLKAKRIVIVSLVLPKGTNELDAHIDGLPYLIRFNTRGNARVEAGTYMAVKQQLEQANVVPANYIDVRVEGHAYYK